LVLSGGCCGETADGEDGDVIFLAKLFGGVGDEEGGLVAEVADAVEAEHFTVGFAGLGDAVGHHEEAVAGVEVEASLLISDVGDDAERQAAGEGNFLTVEVWGWVAGTGDGELAVRGEKGYFAGGEAGAADEDLI
jgi:hypothetical protein